MSVQLTKLLPSAPQIVLSGVLKGVYAAGTDYAPGDVVTYQGGTYIMHTDAAAGTAPTDTAAWQAINSPQAYVESIDALNLVNTSTDNTISVDQNGNVGTDVSTDGALHIDNTGNTGIGLGVYTDIGATASAALVSFKADNPAFDQNVVTILNDGAGNGIEIKQTNSAGIALYIDTETTGTAALKIENSAATRTGIGTNSMFVAFEDFASSSGTVAYIRNDGTGIALDIDSNGVGRAINVDSSACGTSMKIANSFALASGDGNAPLYIVASEAQTIDTTNSAGAAFFTCSNASTTSRCVNILQAGTGDGLRIDMNGGGYGLRVDHDDTGVTASVLIDRNGNNASRIFGMAITVDNAGAGALVGGIDFSAMSDTEPLFKLTSTDTDLSTKSPESDAEAGWFPVLVGTTTYAVPIYALS